MRYGKSLKIATIALFVGILGALIPLSAQGVVVFDTGDSANSWLSTFWPRSSLIANDADEYYFPQPADSVNTIATHIEWLGSPMPTWVKFIIYDNSYGSYPGSDDTAYLAGRGCVSEQFAGGNFSYSTPVPIACDFSNMSGTDNLIFRIDTNGRNESANIFYVGSSHTIAKLEGGPALPKIVATAPATGSTITDTEDTLTIDYFNIDPPYTGFTIGFQDNIIFSNSESVLFNTTGSGTEVISLADFGITTNGHWDLKGFAFGTHLDIQDGFLTTRGYIDFFSDELVDPAYYLLFDVEGLETPYTFTEPTDWYSANVDRFPSPTAFFTDFTGLLDPLFLKIAEFGRQVEPMFDKQGAYDRGYALGEVFPFIGAYTNAINIFFGGFPMVGFFIVVILIMTAMFVIRTIIKFIPFKGN